MSEGYDAVVTYDDKNYVNEIVVLDRSKLKFHKNDLGFEPIIEE